MQLMKAYRRRSLAGFVIFLPDLQLIKDPANDPAESSVRVAGIRAILAL